MKLSVFSFEQHHFKWIPWHCYQVRPCSSVIAVSELLDLLEMETDALADPFTTLSGRWISIGSSATFPDNNREKVQYEKSNLKYLIWQATLEQINGTLPISCLCRVLSIGCPSHHSIAWKLLIRNNLRGAGQDERSPSCTTQFAILHKFHTGHSWSLLAGDILEGLAVLQGDMAGAPHLLIIMLQEHPGVAVGKEATQHKFAT